MFRVRFVRAAAGALAIVACASSSAQVLQCVVSESNGKGYIKYGRGHTIQIPRSSFVESPDGSTLRYEQASNDVLVVSRDTGEFRWTIGNASSRFGPEPAMMSGHCEAVADKRKF